MKEICLRGIGVYGASSAEIPTQYLEAAFETGRLIAEAGLPLICGGGRSGVMASAIEGALSARGEAIGVLPDFMEARGWGHDGLSEKIITAGMHPRKETMMAESRGVIALPGGIGTFEELFEAMTWKQLGLYDGNVVILNIGGFYDPLISMLEKCIKEHFMNPDHRGLWSVATTPAEAIALAKAEHGNGIFSQKIKVSDE